MKISVVMATYNRRALLARTLPAVLTQDFPPDQYEVVVVVDGSTDGTVQMLHTLEPECGFRILQQVNQGQAIAQNAGLQAASGELVLFLDDDIVCPPGLLREHVAAHEESGCESVVFGTVLVSDESRRGTATDWTRACVHSEQARLGTDPQPRWPRDIKVDANTSASRKILLAAGGFDPTFVHGRDNADFGLRLFNYGARFRFRPAAAVKQIYVKRAADVVKKDGWWYGRNEVLLCRKHPDYRPSTPLGSLAEGSLVRRSVRQAVIRVPWPVALLKPAFWICERLHWIQAFRRAGVRLLQYGQACSAYRGAMRAAGSWAALRQEFGMRLPVLVYHNVGPRRPGTNLSLTISAKQFERQIGWLAKRGYVAIRPADWLAWRNKAARLPEKPVLLTFDDAYADLTEHAFPILQRYGFTATVFVVTGHIGETNAWDQASGWGALQLMNSEQIHQWAAAGLEFAPHSRTHPDLRKLEANDLLSEIAGSGDDLGSVMNRQPRSFAYPYGRSDDNSAVAAGRYFECAFTTDPGLNTLPTDAFRLRRTMVWPSDSLLGLRLRLWLGWNPIHGLRNRFKACARTLFGTGSADSPTLRKV